jgi:hypothetical protein
MTDPMTAPLPPTPAYEDLPADEFGASLDWYPDWDPTTESEADDMSISINGTRYRRVSLPAADVNGSVLGRIMSERRAVQLDDFPTRGRVRVMTRNGNLIRPR